MRRMILAGLLLASGCTGSMGPNGGGPALSVLSLDLERIVYAPDASVSGRIARQQKGVRTSAPAGAKLMSAASGKLPTEIYIEVAQIRTKGRFASIEGRIGLRDLTTGKPLAYMDGFTARGRFPAAREGLNAMMRGFDDEVLAWISGLECNARERSCYRPAVATASEATGEKIALKRLVGQRTTSLKRINSAGINPGAIIAAAKPVAPEEAKGGGEVALGQTTATLGLLARAGYWVRTPLVSAETTGAARAPNGKRIAVTLLPKDGPKGGGSDISLAALAALGLGPTDLVTLDLFR